LRENKHTTLILILLLQIQVTGSGLSRLNKNPELTITINHIKLTDSMEQIAAIVINQLNKADHKTLSK
jgi:hypothetical protein